MSKFTTMPFLGRERDHRRRSGDFVGRIEHYVPKQHEAYVLNLMSNVIDPQRWGSRACR